jgi:hypothetical protein
MSSVLSLRRGEYSVVWLPTSPSLDAAMPPADDLKNDPVPSNEAVRGKGDPCAISRFLVAFGIGVATTLAWQSCSDAARPLAQTASLQFGRSAPIAQPTPNVIAPATFANRFLSDQHLAAVQENVDRLAVSPQQINMGIVQLPSVSQQMTRNIASRLQTERYTALNVSVPLPRPAPAEARNHASRPATTTAAAPNAHHTVTSFMRVMASSSPPPALSMRLDAGQKRTRSSAVALRSSPSEPLSGSLIFVRQSVISVLSKITGIQL